MEIKVKINGYRMNFSRELEDGQLFNSDITELSKMLKTTFEFAGINPAFVASHLASHCEKEAVDDTIKEIELSKEVPSAKNTPDFEFWKDNLIELDCGLKFAPEDFYVGDKKFFTWDEGKKYEKETLIPHGFRLPTLADWTAAYCECGQKEDGEDDPDKFEETLKLSKEGCWDWGLALYLGQGSYGRFWSGTPSSEANAYYLAYHSEGVRPQGNYNKGYGFSIRCVAIEEEK